MQTCRFTNKKKNLFSLLFDIFHLFPTANYCMFSTWTGCTNHSKNKKSEIQDHIKCGT